MNKLLYLLVQALLDEALDDDVIDEHLIDGFQQVASQIEQDI